MLLPVTHRFAMQHFVAPQSRRKSNVCPFNLPLNQSNLGFNNVFLSLFVLVKFEDLRATGNCVASVGPESTDAVFSFLQDNFVQNGFRHYTCDIVQANCWSDYYSNFRYYHVLIGCNSDNYGSLLVPGAYIPGNHHESRHENYSLGDYAVHC